MISEIAEYALGKTSKEKEHWFVVDRLLLDTRLRKGDKKENKQIHKKLIRNKKNNHDPIC